MIRMSEIIKMSELKKGEGQEKDTAKEGQQKKEFEGKEYLTKESENREISQNISDIAQKVEDSNMEYVKLYNRCVTLVDNVFNQVRKNEDVDLKEILDFNKAFVEAMLIEGKDQLTGFNKIISIKDYLPSHSVNVSLLSIKIGIWAGLNISDLIGLSVASLLHDLGMIKVEYIVKKEGRLNVQERRFVRRHPEYSEQILKRTYRLNEEVIAAVRTHHDKGSRSIFSQIISLADIYEAITHSRIYKKAKPPHEAMGEIIYKEAASFQPEIIKAFINNIGIYPVGSWIKLSNGDIGIVIDENKGYPLRPKIKIIFNNLGEHLKEVKILDLTTKPYFYIDEPVDTVNKEILEAKWTGKIA